MPLLMTSVETNLIFCDPPLFMGFRLETESNKAKQSKKAQFQMSSQASKTGENSAKHRKNSQKGGKHVKKGRFATPKKIDFLTIFRHKKSVFREKIDILRKKLQGPKGPKNLETRGKRAKKPKKHHF
jgi:hypothetical protein